ncbi:MAG: nitroreductase [Pseudomonadales bacterium]|nr:nitroreductase [Pseudomonadales bacterium]
MSALDALHNRNSSPRLSGNPPTAEQLDQIFRAALRAPDHAQLRPWRFLTISGDSRMRLGELFALAQEQDSPGLSEEQLARAAGKALRAPLIIVVIACIRPHPKVPGQEQIASAAAAAQNILLAAHALELGAIWRTGGMAYHPAVMSGLGLTSTEKIVGYLYLGEREGNQKEISPLRQEDFVQAW